MTDEKHDWTKSNDDKETVLSATKPASEQGSEEADRTIHDEESAKKAHGGKVEGGEDAHKG